MIRGHGSGWPVAGCAAALLVLATLGAPPVASASASASASQARVGKLEHHRVLQQLGIPRRSAMRLAPVFRTGFERDADLAGFYVTPQSPMTRHAVQQGGAHRGARAHVGWLTGQTGPEPVDGPNHRGYPTIQLQKRAAGACVAPCLVQFWARLDDVDLERGEWMSLATLSPDASDRWSRVVTVNVGWEGWLHLFHVPDHGVGERLLQRTGVPFPRGRWVRITIWLDVDPVHGADGRVAGRSPDVRGTRARRRRHARPAAKVLRGSLARVRRSAAGGRSRPQAPVSSMFS